MLYFPFFLCVLNGIILIFNQTDTANNLSRDKRIRFKYRVAKLLACCSVLILWQHCYCLIWVSLLTILCAIIVFPLKWVFPTLSHLNIWFSNTEWNGGKSWITRTWKIGYTLDVCARILSLFDKISFMNTLFNCSLTSLKVAFRLLRSVQQCCQWSYFCFLILIDTD